MVGKNTCKCSVKLENICVRKDNDLILENVNLQANHGEILALIGRNGSGKTTLLKAIMQTINYSGSIKFFGSNGEKIDKPKIGYVPQSLTFDRNTPLTVLDLLCTNLSTFPIWLGYTGNRKQQAYSLLKKVGAEKHINKKIGMLSGGELQRVLLAFALEPTPDILLLDEPVSAVDRKGISLFYDLVTSMRKEFHMPIILVSHDLDHVKKYATTAALIDKSVITVTKASDILKSESICKTFGINFHGGNI